MVHGGTNWNIYFSDNEGIKKYFSFVLGSDINEM